MDAGSSSPGRASQGLTELIGRALTDEQFRETLYQDRAQAVKGYRLTAADRDALDNLPRETLEEQAQRFAEGGAARWAIMIFIRIEF
jgi:hypothetical protein